METEQTVTELVTVELPWHDGSACCGWWKSGSCLCLPTPPQCPQMFSSLYPSKDSPVKEKTLRKQMYVQYIVCTKNMYSVFYMWGTYNILHAQYLRYLISLIAVWEHDNSRCSLLVNHEPEVRHSVWQRSLCCDEGVWAPVTLCGQENTSVYCCTQSKQIGCDEFNYTRFKIQPAAWKMGIHSELMR